jgi:hypothetical protein
MRQDLQDEQDYFKVSGQNLEDSKQLSSILPVKALWEEPIHGIIFTD